jgi:hypothetical protein
MNEIATSRKQTGSECGLALALSVCLCVCMMSSDECLERVLGSAAQLWSPMCLCVARTHKTHTHAYLCVRDSPQPHIF